MSVKSNSSLDTPVFDGDPNQRPAIHHVSDWDVRVHAFLFTAFIIASVGLLEVLLRQVSCTSAESAGAPCSCSASERSLVGIVIAAGSIGGLLHAVTSFVTFAGNRELLRSWLPWLYLRAPLGILLALLVYLGIRAEIFGTFSFSKCSDYYKIAFLAGLSGMFSKQVADKLGELVDNLFVTAKPEPRKDPLQGDTSPKPADERAAQAESHEVIRTVQRHLMRLSILPNVSSDGTPADDGVLDDETRSAIERYITSEGLSEADRAAVLGDETSPDYWSKLLQMLEAEQ